MDMDDAQGILTACYTAPGVRATGVFPLAGKPGTVTLPAGEYRDALSGRVFTGGEIAVGTEAMIFL